MEAAIIMPNILFTGESIKDTKTSHARALLTGKLTLHSIGNTGCTCQYVKQDQNRQQQQRTKPHKHVFYQAFGIELHQQETEEKIAVHLLNTVILWPFFSNKYLTD